MQTHITGVVKRENQCLCCRCFQKVSSLQSSPLLLRCLPVCPLRLIHTVLSGLRGNRASHRHRFGVSLATHLSTASRASCFEHFTLQL